MKSNTTESSAEGRKKRIAGLITGLLIICAGLLAAIILIKTKPVAKQRSGERMTPVVEAIDIATTNAGVIIRTAGTVIPVTDITVQPRVSGQVVSVHPEFIEGGRVRKGDVLINIDDMDYLLAVRQKGALLEKAKSDLALEQGRQDVARREWEMLGRDSDADSKDMALAMREPQLKAIQAAVAVAEVELDQAKVNLERTKISAPENAIVIAADADAGDQATPSTVLGRLAGTDAYWVQVALAVDEIQWLEIPGSRADVILPDGNTREGIVVRLLGDLEPQGRMARVLVEVKDPLGNLSGENKPLAPLIIGEFVTVIIHGRTVEDIYVISRTALRDGSELWLINSEKHLRITPVKILWGNRELVFIRKTWEDNLRLVTSDLATPVEDMSLRIVGEMDKQEPDDAGKKK